jgi:hypothetical protein
MGALSALMFKTLWLDIPEGQYSIKANSTTAYWYRINLFHTSHSKFNSRLRGLLQTRVFTQRVIITSCFYFSSVVAGTNALFDCTNVFGSRTRHTDQPLHSSHNHVHICGDVFPFFSVCLCLYPPLVPPLEKQVALV